MGDSHGRVAGDVGRTRSGAVAGHALIGEGGGLVLVDLSAAGVVRRPVPNLGCFPMAVLELRDVPAVRVVADAPDLRRRLRVEARVLHAAELVGAGRQALALALDYVKERRQFDRAIGSFQAIPHRLADRHTALDAAELLVIRAACAVDDLAALAYYWAVGLLTAREASEAAAKEALQFHGGYGFVTEYDIHRYLRFAKALGVLAADRAVTDDALPTRPGPARRGDGDGRLPPQSRLPAALRRGAMPLRQPHDRRDDRAGADDGHRPRPGALPGSGRPGLDRGRLAGRGRWPGPVRR